MFSYHNHTKFSDGASDIEELIIGATRNKLREVGISDHYVQHPNNIDVSWSMTKGKIKPYFEKISKLRDLYSNKIIVKKGIELDFFKENIDSVYDYIISFEPDYIIGSVHYIENFLLDENKEEWTTLSKEQIENLIKEYWKKILEMALSNKVNIIAHIDIYKKFGYFTDKDFTSDIINALEAIKANKQSVEINTSGFFKPVNEYYPSMNIIKQIAQMEIPVIITADAHCPAHIKRNFSEVYKIIKEMGITTTCRYEKLHPIIEKFAK